MSDPQQPSLQVVRKNHWSMTATAANGAPGPDSDADRTNPFKSQKELDAELKHELQKPTGDDSRPTGKGTGDDTTRHELGDTDVADSASNSGWNSLRKRFTGSCAKGRSSTLPVLAGVPQERPADARTRRGTVSGCVDAVEQDNVVGGEQCMSRRTTATDANHGDRTIPAASEPEDKRIPDFVVFREITKVEQHDAAGEILIRDDGASSRSG